jgi:hypothetical protein
MGQPMGLPMGLPHCGADAAEGQAMGLTFPRVFRSIRGLPNPARSLP